MFPRHPTQNGPNRVDADVRVSLANLDGGFLALEGTHRNDLRRRQLAPRPPPRIPWGLIYLTPSPEKGSYLL